MDRIARDRLASILLSYMNEEISAFQFDEQLNEFRRFPSDPTVESIAHDLWGCYDDIKDHKVVASKETWNYFNRILLLLSSDSEIERVRSGFQWHVSQTFAAACLILAVFVYSRIGRNSFMVITIPLGFLSIGIWLFNLRQENKNPEQSLYPFPSFRALSVVRRSLANFSKKTYPKTLGTRRIRNPIIAWMYWVPVAIVWVLLSPIALLLQALPKRTSHIRLKTSAPA